MRSPFTEEDISCANEKTAAFPVNLFLYLTVRP